MDPFVYLVMYFDSGSFKTVGIRYISISCRLAYYGDFKTAGIGYIFISLNSL